MIEALLVRVAARSDPAKAPLADRGGRVAGVLEKMPDGDGIGE